MNVRQANETAFTNGTTDRVKNLIGNPIDPANNSPYIGRMMDTLGIDYATLLRIANGERGLTLEQACKVELRWPSGDWKVTAYPI